MQIEIQAQIAKLEHKINTYKETAASNAEIIKVLIASGSLGDIQFAAEKAESIARHIVQIPAMEAEVATLRKTLNMEK